MTIAIPTSHRRRIRERLIATEVPAARRESTCTVAVETHRQNALSRLLVFDPFNRIKSLGGRPTTLVYRVIVDIALVAHEV